MNSALIALALRDSAPSPNIRGKGQAVVAEPDETTECTVCTDDVPIANWPASAPTQTCKHTVNVCKSCLARHVEEEVNQKGQTIDVRCPMTSCGKRFDFKDVERWANADVFQRYVFHS